MKQTVTISQVLHEAEQKLKQAGIETADIDAWYLMEHATNLSRASYFLQKEGHLSSEQCVSFQTMLKKRMARIPLQYIIGYQEFMGFTFQVTPDVLVPRQDTECLVEKALLYCSGKRVLDLCTGSGCIIISVALLGSPASAEGVDISEAALAVAKKNAVSLSANVRLHQSDILKSVSGIYDLIISNPPYIPSAQLDGLMPEVSQYEPRIALDGKEDGLFFYREITEQAGRFLSEEGCILFEIGCDQGKAVTELILKAGFRDVEICKDLAGLDRVVLAYK